jgi:signal peptidase I
VAIGNPSSFSAAVKNGSSRGRHYFWASALGAALLILPFRVVEVSGRSMMPTLHNGDRYLVDRLYYHVGGLRRDDVIVLSHDGEQLVKRLVGMPGDHLELVMGPDASVFELRNITTGQNGRLPIDPGVPLFRREITVPRGKIYVLGDNWWRSDDSRAFGSVPIHSIVGLLRTFTLNRSFPRQIATSR